MSDADLEAYMAWCAACEEYARHLDPARMFGGHCESRDSQGRLWDFTFQPLEVDDDRRPDGQVAGGHHAEAD